jgi:hypothetical protein
MCRKQKKTLKQVMTMKESKYKDEIKEKWYPKILENFEGVLTT